MAEGSSVVATSNSNSQILPSTSNFSLNVNPLITAEIRVENIPSSSSTLSVGTSAASDAMESISLISVNSNNNNSSNLMINKAEDSDEPEKKRKKYDHPPSLKNKKVEKLEFRLGGILCCAVCLDLPRSAMYQVRHFSKTNCITKYRRG